MPYQDRSVEAHPSADPPADPRSPAPRQTEANNAKTIQIMIVVGLVLAILVAIFGSY